MKKSKWYKAAYDLTCFLIGCIYVLLSRIINKGTFGDIRPNVGIEVVAYAFPSTGMNLSEDKISKIAVYVYSHILAVLCVTVFLMLLGRLISFLISNSKEMIRITVLVIIGLSLVFVAYCSYPIPIGGSLDTYENFVFAKAWLPKYWHGFLTNVIYCVEMIILPHPVSMVVFPAVISSGLLCYNLYKTLIKRTKLWPLWIVLVVTSYAFLAPMLQTLFFPGRNYMYGTALFALFTVLFSDFLENKELSFYKALWIAAFGATVITWRGEGLIWIPFLPLMILAAYKKSNTKFAQYAFSFASLFILLLILWVPSKYGADKYQGKDYYIINTGSSLGAVFNSPEANLKYQGADKDIENIDQGVPIDWIKAYGGQSFQLWNSYNGRITSQGGVDIDGESYIKSSYNVLFHNPLIWAEERLYVLADALGLPPLKYVKTESGEDLYTYDEAGKREAIAAMQLAWNDYRSRGLEYVAYGHPIKTNSFINNVSYAYQVLFVSSGKYFGYAEILINLAVLVIVIRTLLKREWLFFLCGLALLGTILAIIVASPGGYSNYYFYSFYNEYWLLLFYSLNCFAIHKAKRH